MQPPSTFVTEEVLGTLSCQCELKTAGVAAVLKDMGPPTLCVDTLQISLNGHVVAEMFMQMQLCIFKTEQKPMPFSELQICL